MTPPLRSRVFLLLALSILVGGEVRAATYLPLSDEDLARRAPLIVRARVIGQETRATRVEGQVTAVTVTRFLPLEVFKSGASIDEVFEIALPGGVTGDVATWLPGTPAFRTGNEVILFLAPPAPGTTSFRLTEFGLSKFDVVKDRSGRAFAVRSVFPAAEDDFLTRRESVTLAPGSSRRPLRDAESFAASLRSVGTGDDFPAIRYADPDGEPRGPGAVTPAWVNLGGGEGTSGLYRWFWDTGRSPAARVTSVGTQSGLSDGSDGLSSLQNAVAQWAAVPGASVLYSPSSGSAPVVVNFDVDAQGSYWSEPLLCAKGGVIGLGGPGNAVSAGTFKGDGHYYAVTSANVWMRKVTGGCYSYQTFRTAVLHELGHTLGLGHPDQETSIHSTTTTADWLSAVMVSSVPPSRPSTPQPDDIQAILWLYGTGLPATAPSAAFTVSPGTVTAGQTAQFTDASTGSPSSWFWNFGDGFSSTQPSPAHAFASPGVYTVTLTVSNNVGSNSRSQTVTAAAGTPACPGGGVLCLNNGRFHVEATWRVPSQGTSGAATAVPLTGDTGFFWFFTPNNVEIVIKAVDGRPVNGYFWVFYGALSNVEYTITVTDTATGAVRRYFNPEGKLSSVADTAAFAAARAPDETARVQGRSLVSAGDADGTPDTAPPPAGPEAACAANGSALCLSGGRFQVQVAWRSPADGTSGNGHALPLTSDTGHFWFFTPNNIELVVKVVDGRAFNGRFWVFSGALSDVAYTITVTDMATGVSRSYVNAPGTLASLADTDAF